jgi:hypothetical protein
MARYRQLMRAFARGAMLFGFFVTLLLPTASARAEEKEPLAVFELGAAVEWGLNGGGASSFGPTAAIEFTPIKNWLEVEAGVSTLLSRGQTEWDTDLIFKKPFELSPTVEFEPGVGPVWMHMITGGKASDAIGAEGVLDFMFWPTRDRKFGWFLEPSYGYSFGSGHEQSLGISGGLLISIP